MNRPYALIILIVFLLLGLVLLNSSSGYNSGTQNAYPNSRIDTFNVVHYTINLTDIDLNKKTIRGFTDVQIVLNNDQVDTILLDFVKLEVDSIWVDEIGIPDFFYDQRWIKVPLPHEYDRGTSLQISVFYHGNPAVDQVWGGFYFSGQTAYNMGVAMHSFPHNYGRVWFPCVDNFTDKATYDYYITVKEGLTAVCSGILEEKYINDDGTVTYHWSMKQEIPTYISSVAISDFAVLKDTISGKYGSIVSSIYVDPQDSLDAIISFRNLPTYVQRLEEILGPYRWDRVGFVEVPFSGGAMEHACNIAVSKSSVDGTLNHEMLLVHELAHSWFGNLVTCRRAEDMWLNEGLASYTEALYIEREAGRERFKNYVRENHRNVLQFVHIWDEGFYPVAGIPHHLTYSSTVYNKGSSVAHTLRGFLGDEYFFSFIRRYFDQLGFKNASTIEFKELLESVTEADMNDLFNGWIFSPGFPHFAIDSFHVSEVGSRFKVRLFMRQKLKGTELFTFSNRVDVTFMDNNWHTYTTACGFSGERNDFIIYLPFDPVIAMVDVEEKIGDATTDHYKIINQPGEYAFDDTYCNISAEKITDSVYLRVVHNWVSPDPFVALRENQKISISRYWTIEGIRMEDADLTGTFIYNTGKSMEDGWLDPDLRIYSKESLIMYYRKDTATDWTICDFSVTGDSQTGKVIVNNLLPGEYAIGQYTK